MSKHVLITNTCLEKIIEHWTSRLLVNTSLGGTLVLHPVNRSNCLATCNPVYTHAVLSCWATWNFVSALWRKSDVNKVRMSLQWYVCMRRRLNRSHRLHRPNSGNMHGRNVYRLLERWQRETTTLTDYSWDKQENDSITDLIKRFTDFIDYF